MQTHNERAQKIQEIKRKSRRSAMILLGVLVIGFLIVHFYKVHKESHLANSTEKAINAAPLVEVLTVKPAPATSDLTLPGATAAWYDSTIYARVDGYVGKWYSDIGDHVKKGQVLATIETPELDAELTAAKAKLVSAEANAEFAKTTYARWHDSPKGVVSEQERESKKADYNKSVAEVSLDKADVERYLIFTKFKQVIAPYDGIITQRSIDIGNLVTAGSNASTTPLYHISQNDPIRVFVDVPQNAAAETIPGVEAAVQTANVSGKVFIGKVTRTADSINPKARTLRVEIDIPNPNNALVPGMYVDVSFEIPSKGLMQVPAAALMFRSSGPEVALVDKDNHITFRKVTIAKDNGNDVEIGTGLNAGDRIALNISSQISEGEKVEIAKPEGNNNAPIPKK